MKDIIVLNNLPSWCFLCASALADIEMNFAFAVRKPLKFRGDEGKCMSGMTKERAVSPGLGRGEVAFNFVLRIFDYSSAFFVA